MKTRIQTLLTITLACFALATAACSKKGDAKAPETTGKTAKATGGTKAVKPKATKAVDGKLKAMHAFVDKVVVISKAMCACKDKACAFGQKKKIDVILAKADKVLGKGMPPKAIRDRFEPTMKAAGDCMKKLMK